MKRVYVAGCLRARKLEDAGLVVDDTAKAADKAQAIKHMCRRREKEPMEETKCGGFVRCGHFAYEGSWSPTVTTLRAPRRNPRKAAAERTNGFEGTRGSACSKRAWIWPLLLRRKISSRTDHTGDRGGFQVKLPAQFPRPWRPIYEVQRAPAIRQANIETPAKGTG